MCIEDDGVGEKGQLQWHSQRTLGLHSYVVLTHCCRSNTGSNGRLGANYLLYVPEIDPCSEIDIQCDDLKQIRKYYYINECMLCVCSLLVLYFNLNLYNVYIAT